MHIFYCEKWFNAKKSPINIIDRDSARKHHESREPYTAVIGGEDSPSFVVSLAANWVTVSFLDRLKREYLSYDFSEVQPEHLFLTMAEHRDFAGETDEVLLISRFAFQPDGRMLAEKRNLETGETEERQALANVNTNWEDYPRFENYESVCRKERD